MISTAIFKRTGITILLIFFMGSMVTAQTADQKKIINDAERAKQTLIEKDPEVRNLLNNSVGYAIFPNVGKGAYIVGGASGNGAVYQNDELIGMADLKQLDVGLQLGGQAFIQVLLFRTQAALDRFKEGKFKLSGNASAVALDKGRAESIEFRDGVGVITMPKAGAMIEVSVGGQKFNFEAL
jgi:lipid-binding SYLF domain-containing protein